MNQSSPHLVLRCLILLVLLGSVSRSVAQEFSSGNHLNPAYFSIDVISARGAAPDSARVELHYRLANDALYFVKGGNDYIARFELSIVIHDASGYQLVGTTVRDSIVAKSAAETNSIQTFKDGLFVMEVPLGKHTMMANIIDLESSEETTITRKFTVPDYYKLDLSISDIEFARDIVPASGTSPYVKHGLRVIPSLTRSYGEHQADLYFYYEVYSTADREAVKPLKVTYKIKNSQGSVIRTQSGVLERQGAVGAYNDRLNVTDLAHGTYAVEIEVSDEASRKSARTTGEFHIRWQYLLPLTSAKNYKEIVEQLRYVASADEMKELEKAHPSEQRAVLERFWRRHDPSPGTDKNETMITYYSRVEYANKHFTNAFRKGWKSDMGKVYILFGPPDEVERFPFERDSVPYQIWHYYGIARNFMFIDREGFGQYQLYRIY